MSSADAAAVSAAVVSVIVAIGSVAVTVLSTRATLRRDHDRQEAEFQRTMTARLYDRRLAMASPAITLPVSNLCGARLHGALVWL